MPFASSATVPTLVYAAADVQIARRRDKRWWYGGKLDDLKYLMKARTAFRNQNNKLHCLISLKKVLQHTPYTPNIHPYATQILCLHFEDDATSSLVLYWTAQEASGEEGAVVA